MNDQLEDAVRTFLDRGVQGDVAGSVESLADDALYHLNSWNAPFVGRDAIRKDFERQRTLWSDFRYELLNIASSGNVVFTERIDTVRVDDRDVTIHVVGVFEFDDAGRIASWRDYFDTNEIDTQLQ